MWIASAPVAAKGSGACSSRWVWLAWRLHGSCQQYDAPWSTRREPLGRGCQIISSM